MRTLLRLTALSIVMFAGAPASAQVGIAGSYYDTAVAYPCQTGNACWVRFPQLPLDKYVLFKRVHCAIYRNTGLRTVILATHAGPNDSISARRVTLRPTLVSTTDVNNYAINDEVHFLVAPGRYVTIFVDTSVPDAGYVTCQLIGELMNGPPVVE
jgi:hypothetical protein